MLNRFAKIETVFVAVLLHLSKNRFAFLPRCSILSKKYLFFIVILFGILYSLISLANHYCFRTYALDLGVYTNALYDYIHFQWNDSTVFKEVQENLLADHFDLYLILLSPFSLLMGSYTLLVLQIIFVLFGGIGIYKYFSSSTETKGIALAAMLFFYLFFGVFSAISSDYHSSVLAASLVPWFFYMVKKHRVIMASLLLIIIVVSKVNVSLWMAFVCLGLVIEFRTERFWRNYLLLAFLLCLLYFVAITTVVMPWLSNSLTYPHFAYSFLGSSLKEALTFLFMHPLDAINALFVNHTGNPAGDYVKAELHILLLISGLPLLIKKPQYILLLIPIYFQKLFNDNYNLWGIQGQYCIEFAPIIAIGVFAVISEIKKRTLAGVLTILVLTGAFYSTVRIMDSTELYTDKAKIRVYQYTHYSRKYDVSKVYEQLSKIPKDAIVSAQSPFLPHLALRDKIYQFPTIKDATFIIYSSKESPYPIDKVTFSKIVESLESSSEWVILYKKDGLTVLLRRSSHFNSGAPTSCRISDALPS